MLIRKPDEIKSSEITDEKHYVNRRKFILAAGAAGAAAVGAAWAGGVLAPGLLRARDNGLDAEAGEGGQYRAQEGDKST